MKVFVAGATGAVGRRLVPLLVSRGHHVIATTRDPAKVETIRTMGAEPVILDGLNRDAVLKVVLSSRPDVIVHQMTSLASMKSLKKFDKEFASTNRLRTERTEHLIAAAQAAGTGRMVVQSFTGWPNGREGSRIKTEDDPLDANPPKAMSKTLEAIRTLQSLAINSAGITGTVLRYGSFYGPGTSISWNGDVVQMVRRRKFPVVGTGAGVWSFLHIDDAANTTLVAVEKEVPGIYNIVDDEPAEVSIWLPVLAETVGAKPPRRIPAWLGQLFIGEVGVSMMTKIRGSSNAKAKRLLGWRPTYASWRRGFQLLQRSE